jgi:hypothetical protein
VTSRARYEDNVFINCPFDAAYRPMLDAIVFTVHDAGFWARSALEVVDSAQYRLDKIMDIVADCRFGIHDLSRVDPSEHGLPRFNMPLELGIFLGCRRYGRPRDHRKMFLVMDEEEFRYRRFISDISGQDISVHEGRPDRVVGVVRNWLESKSKRRFLPGGSAIWRRFQTFTADLPAMCTAVDTTPEELTFRDRTQLISGWLRAHAS